MWFAQGLSRLSLDRLPSSSILAGLKLMPGASVLGRRHFLGLSKLFLTIASAEAERDRIRERIGQVKADQKARGRYLGGKVPFRVPARFGRRSPPACGPSKRPFSAHGPPRAPVLLVIHPQICSQHLR